MKEDFVARLGAQLADAAEREARRGPVRRAGRTARWTAASSPVLAIAALLLVVVLGFAAVRALQDDEVPPGSPGPRVVSTTQLVGGGGWMATGFGAVWAVDAASGEVLRVDPGTLRVSARIAAGGRQPPLVTVAGDAVWISAGRRLLELDPATNRVTARIALPPSALSGGAVIPGRGVVWAINPLELLRIDTRRDVVDRRIDLSGDSFQAYTAVSDGRSLYVGRGDGWVLTFDGRTGARVDSAPTTLEGFLFGARDGVVFAGTADGVAAFEAGSGRALWSRGLGVQRVNDAVLADGVAWVHGSDGRTGRDRLWRVDARTGRVRGSVQMPEFGVTRLTVVNDRVWVVSPGGTLVVVE
jgi:outer membrane protein assembly factor BamB